MKWFEAEIGLPYGLSLEKAERSSGTDRSSMGIRAGGGALSAVLLGRSGVTADSASAS